MEDPRRHRTRPTAWSWSRRAAPGVGAALLSAGLAGCGVLATPGSPTVAGSRPASAGPVGYVVCPSAVTPIELASRTSEPPIALPIHGTPPLGDFAVTLSPDGKWAFVVTQTTPPGGATTNVLVPVDLATQRARPPIVLPGHGATSAVVVMHGGRTVLAASGTTVVPVDIATRAVGKPLDLGQGRTVAGMALSPTTPILYVLVADGVVPVDTSTATAGPPIVTGLTVSSVSSPHGLVASADGSTLYLGGQGHPDYGGRVVAVSVATGAVTASTGFDRFGISDPAALALTPDGSQLLVADSADGSTLYVGGQGPPDYGGRVVVVSVATGAVTASTGFDRFGISDPAALALTPDGSQLLVADSADNWIDTVPVANFANPLPPVRLPGGAASGTDHPTDIVTGPGTTGAFVVTGLGSVLPYDPGHQTFGRALRVCSGASSLSAGGTP